MEIPLKTRQMIAYEFGWHGLQNAYAPPQR
jgi:hypothetical protein